MEETYQTTRVLITVMTYPHPSVGHKELVCTAGITVNHDWVRLYPIAYRYTPADQQFHKYQWIDIGLAPRGSGNDYRRESRRPLMESARILGRPLGTERSWEARRAIIDRLPVHTVNQLKGLYESNKTSLGIVRPTRVLDLTIEESEREWKPKWQVLFKQFSLFGGNQKPLAKIPFKFSYIFECEDSTKPHRHMIEDWELGVLYLNEVARFRDEMKAAESVRSVFLSRLCAGDKDTRFFMGTVFPFNSWVVVGVFYPPKSPLDHQLRLFQGATQAGLSS